ncbi:ankyrin [Piedraia hortae CBS 480.64]|uniref:Ankyrin n=1 Tax=Piedraia hortae CBS 480.64 TaxID=1314780 RepID=A0A6A7BV67_9PEZI|nr:ankyrin [Piedraia hortae CBS 480.64]
MGDAEQHGPGSRPRFAYGDASHLRLDVDLHPRSPRARHLRADAPTALWHPDAADRRRMSVSMPATPRSARVDSGIGSPTENWRVPSFHEATSSWSPPTSPGAFRSSFGKLSAKAKNRMADELYEAACEGDLYRIDMLVRQGAPVDSGTIVTGLYDSFRPAKSGRLCPLAGAAKHGHKDAMELLLLYGATLNVSSHISTCSPLHMAVRENNIELVRWLLKMGSNVDSLNAYNTTPLMYAVRYASKEMVKLILSHEPNLSIISFIGAAAIHWTVWPQRPDVLDILLDAGADVDHLMADGSTPLHCAAVCGHTRSVARLLERGANTSLKNGCGLTPQQVAVEHGHIEIAQMIEDYISRS